VTPFRLAVQIWLADAFAEKRKLYSTEARFFARDQLANNRFAIVGDPW